MADAPWMGREIRGLSNDIHAFDVAWVGKAGVTKIEALWVPGEMASVPWFNIWKGDHLHASVNAAQIGHVTYAEATDDE